MGGNGSRGYLPVATLTPQSTCHGPRPGPTLAPQCSRGPPACPATESTRKNTRAGEQKFPCAKPPHLLRRNIRTRYRYIWDTKMHVIDGLEIREVSVLRGRFIDAMWTCSFVSSATVPTCFDGARGGPARRPARRLVRTASSQRYAKPSKRRRARLSVPTHETLLSEGGAKTTCC